VVNPYRPPRTVLVEESSPAALVILGLLLLHGALSLGAASVVATAEAPLALVQALWVQSPTMSIAALANVALQPLLGAVYVATRARSGLPWALSIAVTWLTLVGVSVQGLGGNTVSELCLGLLPFGLAHAVAAVWAVRWAVSKPSLDEERSASVIKGATVCAERG
jgi:hypothetical protein